MTTLKNYLKMSNEIWKVIPMYPTYAASNLGRIKNIKKNKIMSQLGSDLRDYQRVCLSYMNKPYTKKVARMVWAAFNDCECSLTIDHKDGDILNNNIDNLQCITNQENCAKKNIYRNTINKYNLDDNIKRDIVTAYKNKTLSVWQIAKKYKIPPNYLYSTFNRGSWNHLCWNENIINTETSPRE